MADQPNDFSVIFEKMTEMTQANTSCEPVMISQADISEYDEIRMLRQIVLQVQDQPRVFFTTT
jgi:hypothetical protein